jgi:hypothetical protein
VIAADLRGLEGADRLPLAVVDTLLPVVADGQALVVADGLGLVVLDLDVPVLLRVQVDLLGALPVLEPELVRAAAAGGGVRLDGALRLLLEGDPGRPRGSR